MKKENNKTNKKLFSATAMLVLSAAMLGTATYAWFTMNKTVKVTGMQVKAHAEEGLLINEVAAAGSTTWDEEAQAGQGAQFISLRPASTSNLTAWWHASSLKSANEAGYGSGSVDTANTVEISNGVYYDDISNISTEVTSATAGSVAERTVYYQDAAYGTTANDYDDGEGYYVLYKYYIKSSSSTAMNVAAGNFKVNVTAEKQNTETSGTSDDLDKSLRVGVKIGNDMKIFAPVTGADASYNVTNNTAGSAYSAVSPEDGGTDIAFNTGVLAIPDVNTDGTEVDVYVWFEGEDTNCKSDNLTSVLDDYKIDITFTDSTL